jgi:regulator of replication initiation timing
MVGSPFPGLVAARSESENDALRLENVQLRQTINHLELKEQAKEKQNPKPLPLHHPAGTGASC